MSNRATSDACVIVGVDRSLHGLAALRVAVIEATRRNVPLYAIRVQTELPLSDPYQRIDDAFAEALGSLPEGVEVQRVLMFPPVAAALVRYASCERDLLVVGESGRGVWRTLFTGSVSHACLRRAKCPVLAVPAPQMARTVSRRRPWWRPHREDVWERFEHEHPSLRD